MFLQQLQSRSDDDEANERVAMSEPNEKYKSFLRQIHICAYSLWPKILFRTPLVTAHTVRWYREITVEPTMFLYMLASQLTSVVEQSFFVHKACSIDHGLSADICEKLTSNETLMKEVQITVSTFHQWNSIAGHLFPLMIALFLGAWSDRYGRKFPLLIGLFGKFLYSLGIILNIYSRNLLDFSSETLQTHRWLSIRRSVEFEYCHFFSDHSWCSDRQRCCHLCIVFLVHGGRFEPSKPNETIYNSIHVVFDSISNWNFTR